MALPTVPNRRSSCGTSVVIDASSDIPHTSQIGTPIAAKNSNTSRGAGAAPMM